MAAAHASWDDAQCSWGVQAGRGAAEGQGCRGLELQSELHFT